MLVLMWLAAIFIFVVLLLIFIQIEVLKSTNSKKYEYQTQIFEQIKLGMSYNDVYNIIGKDGVQMSEKYSEDTSLTTIIYKWFSGSIQVTLIENSVVSKEKN